jgi:hypothetical protein
LEKIFANRILALRNEQELRMLKKIGILSVSPMYFTRYHAANLIDGLQQAVNQVFWSSVPLIVGFVSFAAAAYVGEKPLTADVIFPAISLFLMLGFPLGMVSCRPINFLHSWGTSTYLSTWAWSG